MVLVKSFFGALKWTIVLYFALVILQMLGTMIVIPLTYTAFGFFVMFIVFFIENLELNY